MLINRGSNIANSFVEPLTFEEKMEKVKAIMKQREEQVEKLRKVNQEMEMNKSNEDKQHVIEKKEKVIVLENKIEEKIDNEQLQIDLSKKFNKVGKTFEVKPETTTQKFIKEILSIVDDFKIKKELVSEDNRQKIEKAKEEHSSVKLNLGKKYFFKFL